MTAVVRNLESQCPSGSFDCTASVTLDGFERLLPLSRSGDHPGLGSRIDTCDPLAAALLVPAMLRGEPLVIHGSIDEMLLESLRGPVLRVHRLTGPDWRHVAIDVEARPAPMAVSSRSSSPLPGGSPTVSACRSWAPAPRSRPPSGA